MTSDMPSATIKLFLVHGDPKRLRTAELSNWTGKAVSGPRTQFDGVLAREESDKSGIYFLTGTDPETGRPAIYIGEAECIRDRVKNHNDKDFWSQVTFFVSKDENLTKAHKRSWWFGLILSYCVILILPTTLYLIQVGRNINTKDAGAYFKRGVSRSKFPITSESNGVTFSVESVSYSGGDLLIRVNMQNKGTNSVRFLYSFLDITDNKGRTLSAITEGLPAKLPPNSREFSGTVSIPTALLDDVNKISLSLVDYPDQKVKLNLVDIPVKPFESQKSTYDELNNIIVTATEDSDKLYQAQALEKNLNIESLLQAIRLADSIKQDSYLYQKSQKLIAELGRNILKLAQEQMDRRNADTALEIARNIPPIPSLQSEIDDFLVLGEAQNSAFIGTVAGLETAISQAQQIDTSRKVYKKAQELIARWQLEIEDLSPQ